MSSDLYSVFDYAFSLSIRLLPIVLFPFSFSILIRFIRYCCLDRCSYNRSRRVIRESCEYPKYKFDDPACAAWVKDFEDKENISIYG